MSKEESRRLWAGSHDTIKVGYIFGQRRCGSLRRRRAGRHTLGAWIFTLAIAGSTPINS